MRPKSLALLVLALGCGLVASIGITQVMKRGADSTSAPDETESVLIAISNVPLGEPLTEKSVKTEQWPKDKIPAGAVGKMEDILGHRCRTRLYAGEPILKSKLLGKGSNDLGVSPQITKGSRVISVKVDAVSGTGLIYPGDHVDVLVHFLQNPSAGIPEPTTKTILQNIKVFAVDQIVNLDSADSDGKGIAAKTVSLLLTPEQAELVTLASEMGSVRLTLRSPEDDHEKEVAGVSSRSIFGRIESGPEKTEQPKAEESHPVLDFLRTVMKPKAEGQAPAEGEMFQMQLFQGPRLQEIKMQQETDPSGSGSGPWKIISQDAGSTEAAETPVTETKPKAETKGPAAAVQELVRKAKKQQ